MTGWSGRFFADLAERVASTAIYGVVTMLTADASGAISGDSRQWWLIVGLPASLSLLKGLLANLGDSESGASALPAPPGPQVEPDPGEPDGPDEGDGVEYGEHEG